VLGTAPIAADADADIDAEAEAEETEDAGTRASVVAVRIWRRWGDLLTAATVALVALGVYVHTLLPGVGDRGDTAKWQTISAVGGVPHATGYPLYVALVQAWARVVPIASFAYRTNLLSAVAAAAAVAVLFGLLRTIGLRPAVAAATALTFAVTPTFWSQAVIAEVYTLHVLFVVSILACLAKWRLGGANGWLLAGSALLALSFGNHMSTALLLPAAGWLVLSDRRRALTRGNVLWAVAVALIGACQYLYLFHMSDVGGYVEWRIDGLDDVWRLATGQQFRDQMWAFGPHELITDRVPLLWRFLRAEYGLLLDVAVVGLVAALLLVRKRRRTIDARGHVLVAIGLVGLASALYGLEYDVIDVYVFFLPLHLVLAIAIGLALDALVGWLTGRIEPPLRRSTALLVAGGLLLLCPVKMFRAADEPASQRGNVAQAHHVNHAVDEAGDDAVFLAGGYHDIQALNYYLRAEGWGRRHHLGIVYFPTPAMVAGYLADGRGPIASAATAVGTPPGTRPKLLTISERDAKAMADAGLAVRPYTDGVWEITAAPT